MYIYHALINALSAHMIHINLNMIFYTHVEHSPTKTIYIKYYKIKRNWIECTIAYIHSITLKISIHSEYTEIKLNKKTKPRIVLLPKTHAIAPSPYPHLSPPHFATTPTS